MTKPKGRTDDMLIIRGINVFPSQIESVLLDLGMDPNYRMIVDRKNNLDTLEVQVEMNESMFSDTVRSLERVERTIADALHSTLNIAAKITLLRAQVHRAQRGQGQARYRPAQAVSRLFDGSLLLRYNTVDFIESVSSCAVQETGKEGTQGMEKEYLIRKRPAAALLIFALPMMLGNFFQQVYTMADSAIVGRLVGEDALAAVGASYSLTNVFISIAIGGGVGASVITSRTFGSREYARMKRSVSTALLSFLGISLLLGGVGLSLSRQIMVLLRTPENILDDATTYLNIYFLGLPFLFMYNVLSSMFNALGRSRIPLYLLIFSSVLNVALDIYMVGPLQMGVAGAAWATLIAQGISAVLSFCIFLKELRAYPGSLSGRLFDVAELKNMAKVALPSILQQSTVSIGMMLVQSVVNSFGSQMLAGYSAAMRIESVCIVPMSAMGNAISSYTAQNIWARASRSGSRPATGPATASCSPSRRRFAWWCSCWPGR